MAALLILNYDVHDAERLAHYRADAAAALLDDPRQLLAATDQTTHLDEAPAGGTHTVVLLYADADEATARYRSDDYQRVVGERWAATSPRSAMIVPLQRSVQAVG